MDEFNKIITILSKERNERDRQFIKGRILRGEHIYTDFCLWCLAFDHRGEETNVFTFDNFLKEESITLTFWQRKHLMEKYFGFKYNYDAKKNKWTIQ